ncbi:hypothetical protein BH09PAT3_BH09PAT3_3170 [soil metagenome]
MHRHHRTFIVSIMLAVLGTTLLSGCDFSGIRDTGNDKSDHASAEQVASTEQTPESFDPGVLVPVKHPWHKGDFQNGIQILWNTQDKYVEYDADRILDYVVDLGANSLGLSFPIYVDGATPTMTRAGSDTPSVQALRYVVEQAKVRKLRVSLRPLIFTTKNGSGPWRGSIDPIPGWFMSYRNFLAPYLDLATASGVDEFVLGTELTSQQKSREWPETIKFARQIYPGKLSYTLNTFLGKKPPFPDLGINMYPKVMESDNASINTLTKKLTKWLNRQQAILKTDLTIQEVAIAGRSNSYLDPNNWADTTADKQFRAIPAMQSKWFAAAYVAAKNVGANGIYFWGLNSAQQFGEDLDRNEQPLGNFVGRPGERAIKALFTQR